MAKELYLIDFDDTLFFTGECIARAGKEIFGRRISRAQARRLSRQEKDRLYRIAFSKYSRFSKPNMIMHRVLRSKRGMKIILSARMPENRKHMLVLLKKYRLGFDRLVTRENNRSADEKWKLRMVKAYKRRYSKITIYEDKIDNATHISKNAKGVHVFLVTKRKVSELAH